MFGSSLPAGNVLAQAMWRTEHVCVCVCVCEVPSMKVLTRGRRNEHSRESHDDSQLLACHSLLVWPQTPCQVRVCKL